MLFRGFYRQSRTWTINPHHVQDTLNKQNYSAYTEHLPVKIIAGRLCCNLGSWEAEWGANGWPIIKRKQSTMPPGEAFCTKLNPVGSE